MTIGKAWIEINQKAIDSDAGTDVESAFRHLRARLAAAKAVKIAVEMPVRLMVISAEHVSKNLKDAVALYSSCSLSHAPFEPPLLQRVLDECKKEELECYIRPSFESSDTEGGSLTVYELLVEPEQGS